MFLLQNKKKIEIRSLAHFLVMLFLFKSFNFILSLVEHLQVALADLLQMFLREESQKTPSQIKGLEDVSSIIRTLSEERAFELIQELKVESIVIRKGFFSHDGLHGHGVFSNGVESVELVGNFRVVHSGHAFSNGGLHQSRKRGKHVDGRVDLSVVELSVNKDLALCDVPGKVGNWVSDIIIRHGQNRKLCD